MSESGGADDTTRLPEDEHHGSDLVVRTRRLITETGEGPGTLHIVDGRIVSITGPAGPRGEDPAEPAAARRCIDTGDLAVMAGLVDTHVHIDDPGRADWEGFEHAGRTAAAGGVTTLVDSHSTASPPP